MKKSEVANLFLNYLTEKDDLSSAGKIMYALHKLIDEGILLPGRHPDYADSLDKFPKGYEWEAEDEYLKVGRYSDRNGDTFDSIEDVAGEDSPLRIEDLK